MVEWIRGHEIALWWVGTVSLVLFLGTLIVIPILVVHIPSDHFRRDGKKLSRLWRRYSAIRFIAFVLKNFFGIVFVLAGLAMLILPGQGIITILIGVMMLNFPGKFALERRIVSQPSVLRAINWIRAKARKPALEVPSLDPPAQAVRGDLPWT